MSRPSGFTLIELMIATTVSLALAAAAVTAFFQVQGMVKRRDAILAMSRTAETMHLQFSQRLAQLNQQCAFVVDAGNATRGGSAKPTLRLLYMRGKEVPGDWSSYFYGGTNTGSAYWFNESTDLTWELWEYRPEEQVVYVANNSRKRSFTIGTAFGAPGANLQNQSFAIMPKPRAALASPDWWLTLNDNCLFPSAADPLVSDASSGDLGDWMELQSRLAPMATGIVEFSVAVVPFQRAPGAAPLFTAAWTPGGTPSAAASSTVASPLVVPGLRQDGVPRDAAGRDPGTAGWAWSSTAGARRPRLLQLRWTSSDAATGIRQTFSHSFLLPGLAGTP